MRLNLATKLEQQQILAPQMILSMDILLLNSLDLESRIEKEFMENPALELEENLAPEDSGEQESKKDQEIQDLYEVLDAFERRYGGEESPRSSSSASGDNRHEALLNHAARPSTLVDYLRQQVGFLEISPVLAAVCRELAGNIDHRGYLIGDLAETAAALSVPQELAAAGMGILQTLDPVGVGAADLRECLLLQLRGEDPECLEVKIIRDHLEDLLENRLPLMAHKLAVTLGEIKEAVEVISLLDPQPGTAFDPPTNSRAIPELFVDEIDGCFKVRLDEQVLPNLKVSSTCSALLKDAALNPKVIDFVKRKIEAARWLIHAIDQRRRTVLDIAQAIVDHQDLFCRCGPGNLAALTMQTIADRVGVHISTVSRAANGKYIETPYGVMELRRFFTGGVEKSGGGIESRDNVCELLKEIVVREDTCRPLSDSQLARKLRDKGIEIARRTVTKYRERAGIPTARLRRKY